MAQTIKRSVMAVVATLFMASTASAAPVAIGWLQWDEVQGIFSVVNQSGVNWLGDPLFPVVTQLDLNANSDLTLTVDGNTATLTPQVGDATSFDSDVFIRPLLAVLTGTVAPLQIQVDVDGAGGSPASLWNIINSQIVALGGGPAQLSGQPIADGDLVVLAVDAERAVQAPEPLTLTLLGTGVAGMLIRRRRLAARA